MDSLKTSASERTNMPAEMTDLELTRLCAEASGLDFDYNDDEVWIGTDEDSIQYIYDPLHDDAQAMAMVKKFRLVLEPDGEWAATWVNNSREKGSKSVTARHHPTLNRAIVECVAHMQKAKTK